MSQNISRRVLLRCLGSAGLLLCGAALTGCGESGQNNLAVEQLLLENRQLQQTLQQQAGSAGGGGCILSLSEGRSLTVSAQCGGQMLDKRVAVECTIANSLGQAVQISDTDGEGRLSVRASFDGADAQPGGSLKGQTVPEGASKSGLLTFSPGQECTGGILYLSLQLGGESAQGTITLSF